MKKALVILLALFMVGVVFAEEPVANLELVKFAGEASVLFGADLDTGSAAFGNEAKVKLDLNLLGKGDKSTTGEGVWGELVVKTDGDEIRWHLDGNHEDRPVPGEAYKLKVDKAQLNFPNGYIGIKKDGTNVDFVQYADASAMYFRVDTSKYYGASRITTDGKDDDIWWKDPDPKVGPNAEYGFVFGYKVPDTVEVKLDLRSFTGLDTGSAAPAQVAADDTYMENAFGIRAKASILAVENLNLDVAVDTGLGGDGAKYDMGMGAKVGYKLALNDTYFVKPNAAINAVMDNAAGGSVGEDKGTEDFSYVVHAGVILGWGDKQKMPSLYWSKDIDDDWGYYPGISVGVLMTSEDYNGGTNDASTGLQVGFMTGSIVENLTAAVALQIADLQADDMIMGFSTVAKYSMPMGEQTIVPKFGINYFSDASKEDAEATDIYVKVGLDIEKIFPNCTLSFEYASNDMNGGVGNETVTEDTMGIFYTKFKIAL